MEIKVEGSMDRAIRELKKLTGRNGLVRELKLRSFPKRSERLRAKARLALKRRRIREARGGYRDRERTNSQVPSWVFVRQDGECCKVHVSKGGGGKKF